MPLRDLSGPGGRRVRPVRGFYLGRSLVTQREYRRVTGEYPSARPDEDAPVDRVSWLQARDYCRALSARARAAGHLPPGWTYRLPSELEWRYAATLGGAPEASGLHQMIGVLWQWTSSLGRGPPPPPGQPEGAIRRLVLGASHRQLFPEEAGPLGGAAWADARSQLVSFRVVLAPGDPARRARGPGAGGHGSP